jgi:hypothetical protein
MRPDRIIVGECRGPETVDMLQAMNTGHDGSLTTAHANTPRDALSRIETLVLTAGIDLPLRAIREQASSAFDLIVQVSRLVDGTRRITHVTEVLRMESDVVTLQDIFLARPIETESEARSTGNRLLGPLTATGIKPECIDKLSSNGVNLPASFFQVEADRPAAPSVRSDARSRHDGDPLPGHRGGARGPGRVVRDGRARDRHPEGRHVPSARRPRHRDSAAGRRRRRLRRARERPRRHPRGPVRPAAVGGPRRWRS